MNHLKTLNTNVLPYLTSIIPWKNNCSHDELLIRELKRKVTVWAEKELLQINERNTCKDTLIKKLKISSEVKQMRIAERMLEITSGPLIIAQARQELIEHYQNTAQSQRYVQDIIDSLSQERALS